MWKQMWKQSTDARGMMLEEVIEESMLMLLNTHEPIYICSYLV